MLDSPFAYHPGRSPLHRWVDYGSDYFGLRMSSKLMLLLGPSVVLFQLNNLLTPVTLFAVSVALLGASAFCFRAIHGEALAKNLFTMLASTWGLAMILGLPVGLGIGFLFGYGSVSEWVVWLTVLATETIAALATCALFLSTTSIGLTLARWNARGTLPTMFALALAGWPKCEERIRLSQMGLRSLGLDVLCGASTEPPLSRTALLKAVLHRGYFLTSQTWDLVSVLGPRTFLMFRALAVRPKPSKGE